MAAAAALDRALAARRVAVFGASGTPGKWGYILVRRLLEQGYDGELVLVNPRGGTAFGRPLVEAGAAAGCDLAVAVTPAARTPAIVDACGELGVPTLIVESAGFGEAGEAELERQLAQRAAATGVRIIGPNCLGLFVGPGALNLTTLPALPRGRVSFVTQSGGLTLQVARRLAELGSGFDVMLSLGNKLDIGFTEALRAIAERPSTGAILVYLERLDEGDAMLDQIQIASASVPVVAVMGGRTTSGREAARSHTGSILSRFDRAAGVLADSGARVVESLALATVAVTGGARRGQRPTRRVYAVVDGGGHSVLLADALAGAGHELAPPSTELAGRLRSVGGKPTNPLELAGAADSDPEVYARLLAPILESGAYDAVVLGGIFGGYGELFGERFADAEIAAAEAIGSLATHHGAPVILQTTFARAASPALEAARGHGVLCVEWPEEVVAALADPRRAGADPAGRPIEPARATQQADSALADSTGHVIAALDAAGLAHGLGTVVARDALPTASERTWVLRLDGFAHKQAAGAMRLAVPGAALAPAYDELAALAHANGLPPSIRIATMLEVSDELLVTFWRHPTEGRGWAVGAGGAQVEEQSDVAVGRLPRDERDVVRLLAATVGGRRVLAGERAAGLPPFLLSLAAMFDERLDRLRELELNPVALTADGPIVLDALPS